MRSFRHWTPRYIKNRVEVFFYEKEKPDDPWLTRSANEMLDSWLTKSDVGVEFGSGRSTIWFAKRVGQLISVEHNDEWARHVRRVLSEQNLENVDYRRFSESVGDDRGFDSEYLGVIDEVDEGSLDFCVVDGVYRELCALKVLEKIRPGGLLIIDDANRYFPSDSYSPNSRRAADGPKGRVWQEVAQQVSSWRKIWTSSGVTDTALFFKPCGLK